MSERAALIREFLARAGWDGVARRPLAGDASTRRYERLEGAEGRAVLMDAPPGPDGPPLTGSPPYSRIAHLAEDCRPFVAIGEQLRRWGLSAPALYACDLDNGLLLLEDLGDDLYGPVLDAGVPPAPLYETATDVLLAIHGHEAPARLPLPGGDSYDAPFYDEAALAIEAKLLVDWYLPLVTGRQTPEDIGAAYLEAWRPCFPLCRAGDSVLLLRDYHSPNLVRLAARRGLARVGLLDYQDGLLGPAAYDLVSLLQDARRDVAEPLEAAMLARYLKGARATHPDFDETAFRTAYAVLGAQRNCKIIGIFARLCVRDGKPRYLAHLPRVFGYLERDLAHPALAPLKAWLDRHIPAEQRRRIPEAKVS